MIKVMIAKIENNELNYIISFNSVSILSLR